MSQIPKSPVQEICTPGSVGVGPPNGGPSTRRSYPNTMGNDSDNLKRKFEPFYLNISHVIGLEYKLNLT